jgi:CBS domain containing-hemolysin-like protein
MTRPVARVFVEWTPASLDLRPFGQVRQAMTLEQLDEALELAEGDEYPSFEGYIVRQDDDFLILAKAILPGPFLSEVKRVDRRNVRRITVIESTTVELIETTTLCQTDPTFVEGASTP